MTKKPSKDITAPSKTGRKTLKELLSMIRYLPADHSLVALVDGSFVVAEAKGDVASAEIEVLNAELSIQMFGAEIALIDAETELSFKEGALQPLSDAALTAP